MKVCHLQHNCMKHRLENVPRLLDEILYNMDLAQITQNNQTFICSERKYIKRMFFVIHNKQYA